MSRFALPASQPASKLVNIIKRRRLLSFFYCWSTVQFSRTIVKKKKTQLSYRRQKRPWTWISNEWSKKRRRRRKRWCKLFSPVLFLYIFTFLFLTSNSSLLKHWRPSNFFPATAAFEKQTPRNVLWMGGNSSSTKTHKKILKKAKNCRKDFFPSVDVENSNEKPDEGKGSCQSSKKKKKKGGEPVWKHGRASERRIKPKRKKIKHGPVPKIQSSDGQTTRGKYLIEFEPFFSFCFLLW